MRIGSLIKITAYGGTGANKFKIKPILSQFFPADQETSDFIGYAYP